MFDVPAALPAAVRTLRICCARDHAYATRCRNAAHEQARRTWYPRANRLSRSAALARARAADLRTEVLA